MDVPLSRASLIAVMFVLCGCGPHAAYESRPKSPRRHVAATPTRGCGDPRLTPLLLGFRRAIATADGAALQRVTSPARGLALQQDETSVSVVIAWAELATVFVSQASREWGENDTSEEPVVGSFRVLMLPTLQRAVAGPSSEVSCGDLQTGGSAATYALPETFAELTPVSFYAPSTDGTNDWVTWTAAVEYIEEKPYVVALVRYHYEM